MAWSGKKGQPIVYDGNTEGKFGQGKAIIQGGEPVTGWRKVASAEEVEQNPHWQKLYYTYLDGQPHLLQFRALRGRRLPRRRSGPEARRSLLLRPSGRLPDFAKADKESLVDAEYFTAADPDYYAGAYLALHIQPNYVCCQAITGYVPAEHKVTYKPHGQGVYRGIQRYALLNSLKILSRPGEYYLDEKNAKGGKVRLVIWPHKPGPNGPENVIITTRHHGFLIQNANHVVIDGFKICHHGGHPKAAGIWKPGGAYSTGIVIRNNEVYRGWPSIMVNTTEDLLIHGAVTLSNVSHSLVENNALYENRRLGILGGGFDDSVCRNNYLSRNGSTAASFHTCQRSKIQRNVVWDNLGIHANGISVYLRSDDILWRGTRSTTPTTASPPATAATSWSAATSSTPTAWSAPSPPGRATSP